MFTSVAFRTLGANITSGVLRLASGAKIIGSLVQRTSASFTIVRSAVHSIPVETDRAFVTLWSGCVVFTYLQWKKSTKRKTIDFHPIKYVQRHIKQYYIWTTYYLITDRVNSVVYAHEGGRVKVPQFFVFYMSYKYWIKWSFIFLTTCSKIIHSWTKVSFNSGNHKCCFDRILYTHYFWHFPVDFLISLY